MIKSLTHYQYRKVTRSASLYRVILYQNNTNKSTSQGYEGGLIYSVSAPGPSRGRSCRPVSGRHNTTSTPGSSYWVAVQVSGSRYGNVARAPSWSWWIATVDATSIVACSQGNARAYTNCRRIVCGTRAEWETSSKGLCAAC
jgi:hypothetical protein